MKRPQDSSLMWLTALRSNKQYVAVRYLCDQAIYFLSVCICFSKAKQGLPHLSQTGQSLFWYQPYIRLYGHNDSIPMIPFWQAMPPKSSAGRRSAYRVTVCANRWQVFAPPASVPFPASHCWKIQQLWSRTPGNTAQSLKQLGYFHASSCLRSWIVRYLLPLRASILTTRVHREAP